MPEPIIDVRDISKSYLLGSIGAASLSESIALGWQRIRGKAEPPKRFDALKNVSFQVQRGDVLGIVGGNGAGKSTLLKILSRITEPSAGEITLRGRVASLLEAGTGFHPELTGRENVFLNGAILGMKKREILEKFDEIVDFAGVERFIDTPTKRYSSGMSVRLAFAVAAHLDPDILIVDEVLAVGDASFQRKCLDKMQSVTELGRTVLFVSHNLGAVANLCSRALLIEEGHLTFAGETDTVIQRYIGTGRNDDGTPGTYAAPPNNRLGQSHVSAASIHAVGRTRDDAIICGDSVVIAVELELSHPTTDIKLGIGIDNSSHSRLLTAHPDCDPRFQLKQAGTRVSLRCQLERPGLVEAIYSLTFQLVVDGQMVQKLEHCLQFEISAGDYFGNAGKHFSGSFLVEQKWSYESASSPPVLEA